MKKTFILSAFTVLLLATSCGKDFVTVRHNSSEPLDEYFINESRMYEGLIAAYDPLQWYDYFYQYTSLNFIYDTTMLYVRAHVIQTRFCKLQFANAKVILYFQTANEKYVFLRF